MLQLRLSKAKVELFKWQRWCTRPTSTPGRSTTWFRTRSCCGSVQQAGSVHLVCFVQTLWDVHLVSL
jgi:hypothetical protein